MNSVTRYKVTWQVRQSPDTWKNCSRMWDLYERAEKDFIAVRAAERTVKTVRNVKMFRLVTETTEIQMPGTVNQNQ